MQRRKKQQDPSRHGRRILQKGAVAFPNYRQFCSRTSYAAERHVTNRLSEFIYKMYLTILVFWLLHSFNGTHSFDIFLFYQNGSPLLQLLFLFIWFFNSCIFCLFHLYLITFFFLCLIVQLQLTFFLLQLLYGEEKAHYNGFFLTSQF